MKTPLEWNNEVGETVALDMFIAETKPGERTLNLIAAIQADAREGMVEREKVKCLVEALRAIDSERWSCEVSTGILGRDKSGPWRLVDGEKLDKALETAKSLGIV